MSRAACVKCDELSTLVARLTAERDEARDAIRAHRDQKADDRCIEDDDRLYAVLRDGFKCDRRVGDKAAMLANCQRFIERRCEGGGWPTYVEVEIRAEKAERERDAIERKTLIRAAGVAFGHKRAWVDWSPGAEPMIVHDGTCQWIGNRLRKMADAALAQYEGEGGAA